MKRSIKERVHFLAKRTFTFLEFTGGVWSARNFPICSEDSQTEGNKELNIKFIQHSNRPFFSPKMHAISTQHEVYTVASLTSSRRRENKLPVRQRLCSQPDLPLPLCDLLGPSLCLYLEGSKGKPGMTIFGFDRNPRHYVRNKQFPLTQSKAGCRVLSQVLFRKTFKRVGLLILDMALFWPRQ